MEFSGVFRNNNARQGPLLLDPDIARMLCLGSWIICQALGNPALLGLIDFEKRGGDPMKRNLIDMVGNYT